MSEKIDKFCDDLKTRLNGIESQVDQVKQQLLTVSKDAESTVRAKLDDAKTTLDTKKQEFIEMKEKLAKGLETKKVEVQAQVAEWKEQRDQQQLLSHADEAEDYALTAIAFAGAAAEEARVAVLEAIAARKAADSITTTATEVPAESLINATTTAAETFGSPPTA